MAGITFDPNNVSAAEALIPKDVSILMLNLLRWKQQAEYSDHPDLPPCSGQEAYVQRYIPAFNEIAAGIEGIKPYFIGAAVAHLVAPGDEGWDVVALVRYPNFVAFRAVTQSDQYRQKAQHHRLAALKDWRLIAIVELTVDQFSGE